MRVTAQMRSAGRIADFLSQHPAVVRTLYPGCIRPPQAALAEAADGRRRDDGRPRGRRREGRGVPGSPTRCIIGISNNLGDAKSLITHPATTTHQRLKPEQRAALGIAPGLLRLSVGLEDVDDLIEDLAQALDKASLPRQAAE